MKSVLQIQKRALKSETFILKKGTKFKQRTTIAWKLFNGKLKNNEDRKKRLLINETMEEEIWEDLQNMPFCINTINPVEVTNPTEGLVQFYCKSHPFLDRCKVLGNNGHVKRIFAEAEAGSLNHKITQKRLILRHKDVIYCGKFEDWIETFIWNYTLNEKQIFVDENERWHATFNIKQSKGLSKSQLGISTRDSLIRIKDKWIDSIQEDLEQIKSKIDDSDLDEYTKEFTRSPNYEIIAKKVMEAKPGKVRLLFKFPYDEIPRLGFDDELKYPKKTPKKSDKPNFEVNKKEFDRLIIKVNTFIEEYLKEKKTTQNQYIDFSIKQPYKMKRMYKYGKIARISLIVELEFEVK